MRRLIILAIMECYAIFARYFFGLALEARCARKHFDRRSSVRRARKRVALRLFSASFKPFFVGNISRVVAVVTVVLFRYRGLD